MPSSFKHFGVVGAGAWGTALALALKRAGRDVSLWAFEPDVAVDMAKKHENAGFLPGVKLPEDLRVTNDMADLAECNAIVLAVPAQHTREICKQLAAHLKQPVSLIIAAKGIELTSHRLMSEVVSEVLPKNPVYVLSGPSFAFEVARNLPAALTLASEWGAENLALAMSSPTFRLYTTDDIIGTQIGGAVKNVLAIACGIVEGRKLGENARAALITRGLAEIVRLGIALGARAETMTGLSGLGDIVLTCTSLQSRNMSLGFQLGKGNDLNAILATRKSVTEGISTAAATLGLARRHGVEMPIVGAVDLVLRGNADIDVVVAGLLARPLRNETV